MKDGEEDGEVAPWCYPQLYVAHALECALQLCHAGDEAHYHEQSHVGAIHGDDVAHGYGYGGTYEQLLVGEAELHPEQQREIDGHACQAAIEKHEQVLDHKVGGPSDTIQCSQIDTAGELYAKDREHIYPRPDGLGHPTAEHGHGE